VCFCLVKRKLIWNISILGSDEKIGLLGNMSHTCWTSMKSKKKSGGIEYEYNNCAQSDEVISGLIKWSPALRDLSIIGKWESGMCRNS